MLARPLALAALLLLTPAPAPARTVMETSPPAHAGARPSAP